MADTFYRTIIKVEVLSEHPFEFNNLRDVHHAITDGDCSGDFTVTRSEEVSPKRMARLLKEQGSDPSFFGIDEKGRKLDDDGSDV